MTVSTVAPRTDERRASRYLARFHLWKHSTLRRVQACGRVGRTEGVAVKMTESAELGRRAGWAGVATCGSVWVCPVCSAKIAAYRQNQIENALAAWADRGGRVALSTFTMRHERGQSLASLWDGVSYAWGRVTSGRSWQADQLMLGVPMARVVRSGKREGQTVVENRIRIIRVVEVTHGEAGWHVHVHALLLLDQAADLGSAQTVVAAMFGRWQAALVASGFRAPEGRKVLGRDGKITRPGWDVRMLDGDPAGALGEYFTKSVYNAHAVAMEAARGDLKDGRAGSLTPFGILRSLVTTGEDGAETLDDAETARRSALWAEWETTSKGRRQIAWTAGLKDELIPEDEDLADEDIVELDELNGDVVAVVDNRTYAEIAKARATYVVLAAFERSPAEGWALLELFQARAGLDERERGPGDRRRAEAALAENWA